MATQANQSVHTGNTILIMINNAVVGRAQSIEGSRSYGTQAVREIGSIMVQEHVYLQYDGTITLNRFLMKRESLDQLGLVALGEDILTRDIIDIVVIDKLTNTVVRAYRGCTANDTSESFSEGQIASETATFSYLEARSVN